MINKYFRLAKEVEDLEAEIESNVYDLAEEEGQEMSIYFYTVSFQVTGEYFSTHFRKDGTRSTSPLCKSNDMPDTVDEAVEKTKEIFKAKDEWERLLVKIDEVLKEQ